MVDGEEHDLFDIDAAAVALVADDGQRMADHGYLQRMFLIVFLAGIPAQAPSADELHPRHVSVKMAVHVFSPLADVFM
jgi:hypothetical protein